MPLILVQSEVTANVKFEKWKNIEGEQYHYPNKYRNKVIEGESFIYYRGARRVTGKRETPEYFGFGKVGRIWLDPESVNKGSKGGLEWFCEIAEYLPFINPVPFTIDGQYRENNLQSFKRDGVRVITQQEFDNILSAAGIIENSGAGVPRIEKIITGIENVQPQLIAKGDSLIVPNSPKINDTISEALAYPSSPRYSKYAKLYGDRAEEVVFKLLTARAEHKLAWVAREGKKPGWDIEYYNNDKEIAVEVKGTSGKRFKSLEITAGEWKAAEEKRENYNLYLVADCLSTKPLIQVINNPYGLYERKEVSLVATGYRILFNASVD